MTNCVVCCVSMPVERWRLSTKKQKLINCFTSFHMNLNGVDFDITGDLAEFLDQPDITGDHNDLFATTPPDSDAGPSSSSRFSTTTDEEMESVRKLAVPVMEKLSIH